MDPLVELLLELGSRAKLAERQVRVLTAQVVELEAKVAELSPKEVAPEPAK